MKKISVIIPVYNGEAYISRCIESILAQTKFPLEEIEINLLNDGSTDSSTNILQGYAADHPSIIRVFEHENRGIAETRNRGINVASGKYLIFMDQDDFIDKDYISTFYREAEAGDSDVVVGGYRRPSQKGKVIFTSDARASDWRMYKQGSVWAKIHRRDFIKNNNIKFYDGYGEDVVFSCIENVYSKKIKQIEYTGYNWFYNEDSVSNTTQKKLDDVYIKKAIDLLNTLKQVFGDNITTLQYQTMLYVIPGWMLNCVRQNNSSQFLTATSAIFKWFEQNYPHHKSWIFMPAGGSLKEVLGLSSYIFAYRLKLLRIFTFILRIGIKND